MNDVVGAKLKKSLICKILLKQMSYIINQNVEKFIILMNILCLFFLRDIHEGHLSLEDADDKQSNFAAKLKNLYKVIKTIQREVF